MRRQPPPRWLGENFRLGVVYPAGARCNCALAALDPLGRSCSGRIEAAHAIPRQRVRSALGALLPWGAAGTEQWNAFADLIQIAEWDPRNGIPACADEHHPRFDSHRMPTLVVPAYTIPGHVAEFCDDWGLESEFERRFPVEVAA